MSAPDRTKEVSFDVANQEAGGFLLNNRLVVMKNCIRPVFLPGVGEAYEVSRRHDLPRRITGRAIASAGLRGTLLYRKVRVSDIAVDPANPPRHMRAAEPVLDRVISLNTEFFKQPALLEKYGHRIVNLALFALSNTETAFTEHQDSQGATGLAYAPQMHPTHWRIHERLEDDPHPPAPVAYTFETSPGDIVVLTEREGPCPEEIPFRQGEQEYLEDGSLIHSGLNMTGSPRYAMGVFHQEMRESL